MAVEEPGGLAVVLEAIETQRQETWESSMATIREIEAERDDLMGRLDRAVAVLDRGKAARMRAKAPAPAATHPSSKPRGRRRARRSGGSPAAVHKRCEAIFRYLVEQNGPVAQRQICRILKISPASTRTALIRLGEEGKIIRTGTGSATCYKVKVGLSAVSGSMPAGPPSEQQGTLQGRILMLLQDRGSASLDELAQALGAPGEQILRECGSLIRQEEIRMGRRDGRPVYIGQVAA
jgi:hypothetical protein